jgi:hypothetical protein
MIVHVIIIDCPTNERQEQKHISAVEVRLHHIRDNCLIF